MLDIQSVLNLADSWGIREAVAPVVMASLAGGAAVTARNIGRWSWWGMKGTGRAVYHFFSLPEKPEPPVLPLSPIAQEVANILAKKEAILDEKTGMLLVGNLTIHIKDRDVHCILLGNKDISHRLCASKEMLRIKTLIMGIVTDLMTQKQAQEDDKILRDLRGS